MPAMRDNRRPMPEPNRKSDGIQKRHVLVGATSDLGQLLRSLPSDIRVVSFDVFDTLVERRIRPPEQVKWLAARRFLEGVRPKLTVLQARVVEIRGEVEAELRELSRTAGLDGECRFTQVARGMARRLRAESNTCLPTSDIGHLLIQCELDAERHLLVPKPGMAELLGEIKLTGRRLIAVSDMYLDAVLVRELLDAVGLGQYLDAVYVSSDFGLGKHSGRLFDKVFELEGTPPCQFVHVGDNEHADLVMPLARGAHAVHFRNHGQANDADLLRACGWLAGRNAYWRGKAMLADLAPPESADFLFSYGFRVLGPVYAIFVARLREHLIERGTEKVFFLAREGDLFREIYELFQAPVLDLPTAPPSHYLYISRKVVALPACHRGMSPRLLRGFAPWLRTRGLGSLAISLGIEPEAFAEAARRLGLPGVNSPMRDPRRDWLSEIVADADLQTMVRQRAAPGREELRAYLQQEGFFGTGRKIAVCDIGWAATTQRALIDAFGDETFWPDLRGYYLDYEDSEGYELGEKDAVGVLFDRRRDHFRHAIFCQFRELFENGARALHGSTLAYERKGDGCVVPVLQEAGSDGRQAERNSDAITMSLRGGALAFATAFVRRHALYGYGADSLVPYAHEVARRAIIYPTPREVAELSRMVHLDNAGPIGSFKVPTLQQGGLRAMLQPRQLRRLMRETNWKYGTSRSIGLPGLNHLMRGAQLLIHYRKSVKAGQPRGPEAEVPGPRAWESAALKLARAGALRLRRGLRPR